MLIQSQSTTRTVAHPLPCMRVSCSLMPRRWLQRRRSQRPSFHLGKSPRHVAESRNPNASSASGGDRFGGAVALRGGIAAVSSKQYSDGSSSGIVYVFSRNACSSWASNPGITCNSQWGLLHTLTASGASNLGASVALDGPFLHASSVSQSSNAGRVFRFRRKI